MPSRSSVAGAQLPIVVVGAGVIGTLIAYELQRRGRKVVLLDRAQPGRGASFGNLASIAITEFLPASRPAIWARLPGWVLDREGPVRLSPSYLWHLMPWLARFLKAGLPSHFREIEAAAAALCKRAYDDLLPLLADANLSAMLSAQGCLSLYMNEAEFAADRAHIAALERFGFAHELLGGPALHEREPSLAPGIARAILLPHNRSVSDPHAFVTSFFASFIARGGGFLAGSVVEFGHDGQGVNAARLEDGRLIEAAAVILCAGAHTGRLARTLGEFIPLESERGYHTQIMAPGLGMRHSLIWPAKAFMVTPTASGLRVGGGVEMAGLEAEPDFRRARLLVKRAREVLPALVADQTTEWMGHRPALPDTIPVIGPSARLSGIWYATGHGHLGLTLAATTARLMADLVTGRPPPLDMTPYRVDRF